MERESEYSAYKQFVRNMFIMLSVLLVIMLFGCIIFEAKAIVMSWMGKWHWVSALSSAVVVLAVIMCICKAELWFFEFFSRGIEDDICEECDENPTVANRGTSAKDNKYYDFTTDK